MITVLVLSLLILGILASCVGAFRYFLNEQDGCIRQLMLANCKGLTELVLLLVTAVFSGLTQ
jgi:hypothetical protein